MRAPGLLLCVAALSACTTDTPPAATDEDAETVRTLGHGDCTGTGAATFRVADRDLVLRFDDLALIQREVERFLAEEEPAMEPSVSTLRPGGRCRGRFECSRNCEPAPRSPSRALRSRRTRIDPALRPAGLRPATQPPTSTGRPSRGWTSRAVSGCR